MGAALAKMPERLTGIQAYLAVHESFHLHSQTPMWLDLPHSYAWPSWDRQPNRAALVKQCYQDSSVAADFTTEHATLYAAWAEMWLTRDPSRDSVRARTQRYLTLRDSRHQKLAAVRIPLGDSTVSCADAEELMELEEGAPQWIAHTMVVRAGVSSISDFSGSYQNIQPEAFYQTGPMALWIIEGLKGRDGVRDVTRRLSRSTDPHGPDGSVVAALRAAVRD